MSSSRTDLEVELARTLLPLARRWRVEADHAVAGFGLSDATGWTLLHLNRMGEDARQGDLAAAVDIQGASLVRLLDQLETMGLVERRVDPSDRRVNNVLLTDAGRKMADDIEQAIGEIRAALFEGIEDQELRAANKVLQRLAARVIELRSRRE